jgi:Fe-S cluster assembly scaffold protein SufB
MIRGVTHATAQHMMVRGFIERDQAATPFVLSGQGRAVLFHVARRFRAEKSPA